MTTTPADTQASESKTLSFQTEVKQLMHLLTHSVYSNKEIFLRELVSNASDAIEKYRYAQLTETDLQQEDEQAAELKITLELNEEANTITITDNGIGMSEKEVIENLGTIAHSGTAQLLEAMQSSSQKDLNVIGQFGIGFYSAFLVADTVTVHTRRAGLNADQGVSWVSQGEGEFTLSSLNRQARGTSVILHLRDEAKEFLSASRLKSIITHYSNHIPTSIWMLKEPQADVEKQDDQTSEDKTTPSPSDKPEWEVVNKAKALWRHPKKEIKKEQYEEFYSLISHAFEPPLAWTHHHVEGKLVYTALLYLPKTPPFDLYYREARKGLKLYVQRVFIMDEAEHFLPGYLRFVKGVIDCNDLPLNVSREILQNNPVTAKIKSACTSKLLSLLANMADKEPEKYATFWQAFGQVLKEGPGEDFANKSHIVDLLRFASTKKGDSNQTVSLKDYVARMKPGQEKIYYIVAEGHAAAKQSPHLELFEEKGIEVLLLSDKVDEWLMAHLTEYQDKQLQSITKGEVDLDNTKAQDEKKTDDSTEKEDTQTVEARFGTLITQLQTVLKDQVKSVRTTKRLTHSPACLVSDENEMSANLQRMLQDAGQAVPDSKPILELNPDHPLITRLHSEQDEALFASWAQVLFDQAALAEGGRVKEPGRFVKSLNQLMLRLTQDRATE